VVIQSGTELKYENETDELKSELGTIEREEEGHVGVVDMDIDELDDVLVVDLAQELPK
jgi:hypothetical protein